MKAQLTLTVSACALTMLTLGAAREAGGQEPFPDAPGRDTLFLACTQCHSLGKMVAANLTTDDWQFLVYDMIARGSPVHQEDIADLTKYLQDNFANDR
jgi:hypothetical protein